MTIQPIGATSVALYLTPDDLRPHGVTPEEMTQELALDLTRLAFAQAGIFVEGTVEIDAYPDPWGVLVFARFQRPQQVWFPFSSLEELLSAAQDLQDMDHDGDLVWCDGAYWLSLPPGAEQAVCRLSEFTSPAEASPLLSSHLDEHGLTLLIGEALAVLLRYFPEKME